MLNFKITPIFPSPLYQATLDREVFNSSLPKLVELSSNFGNRDMNFLNHFPELKNHISVHIDNYVKEVLGEREGKFKLVITNSWHTRLNPSDYHYEHDHANSIISGVFYFNNKDGVPPLSLMRENNNTSPFINLSPSNPTYFTNKQVTVPVINGNLILFPSYMMHKVDINKTVDVRNAVAFDTFVVGEIGSWKNNIKVQIL